MEQAREVLAEQPRNAKQLRETLGERFPAYDASAMAFACRNLLAFVQVPPRGLWSQGGEVVGTTAEAWLGRPLDNAPAVDDVILRYVAAFGPATVRDAATWSRYTGLREVFDRLRPRLRTFRDEAGRELFDVPESTLVDPDVRAPVRLLPEYDNVLLAHADRSRIVTDDFRARMPYARLGFLGNLLIDGMLAGGWRVAGNGHKDRSNGLAPGTLLVYTVDRLDAADRDAVEEEARRLQDLLAPGADHDVVVDAVG